MLTDGKSRNSEFVWSNKGDRIAYASTLRNNADLDFYVMDPAAKPEVHKPLTENQGGGWQVADWSPDDRTLLAVNGISINESHLWLVDVATGTKKELTLAGGEKVAYSPIGFSRNGKGVYLTTDKDNEFQRIAYMDHHRFAEVSDPRLVGRRRYELVRQSRVIGLRRQ
jgi:Tol biopolymer transport system component